MVSDGAAHHFRPIKNRIILATKNIERVLFFESLQSPWGIENGLCSKSRCLFSLRFRIHGKIHNPAAALELSVSLSARRTRFGPPPKQRKPFLHSSAPKKISQALASTAATILPESSSPKNFTIGDCSSPPSFSTIYASPLAPPLGNFRKVRQFPCGRIAHHPSTFIACTTPPFSAASANTPKPHPFTISVIGFISISKRRSGLSTPYFSIDHQGNLLNLPFSSSPTIFLLLNFSTSSIYSGSIMSKISSCSKAHFHIQLVEFAVCPVHPRILIAKAWRDLKMLSMPPTIKSCLNFTAEPAEAHKIFPDGAAMESENPAPLPARSWQNRSLNLDKITSMKIFPQGLKIPVFGAKHILQFLAAKI